MKTIKIFLMLATIIVVSITFTSCDGSEMESSIGNMSVFTKEGTDGIKVCSGVIGGKTVIPFEAGSLYMEIANGCFISVFRGIEGRRLIDANGNDLLPQYEEIIDIKPFGEYFSFYFYFSFIGDYVYGIVDRNGKFIYEPESVLRDQKSIEMLDAETAVLTFDSGRSLRVIDLRNGEIIVTDKAIRILYTTPLSFLTVFDRVTLEGRERTYNLYGRNGSKDRYKKLNTRPIGSVFTIEKGQKFINYYTLDKQHVGYIDLETGIDEVTEEIQGWED